MRASFINVPTPVSKMTPEQFAAQMNDLVKKVLDDNAATRAHSTGLHTATQARVDGLADTLRSGLRDDVTLLIKPVADKVESHSKKLDDHETRIRGLEASGIKRDLVVGSAASLGMVAVVEAVKAVFKFKTGGS